MMIKKKVHQDPCPFLNNPLQNHEPKITVQRLFPGLISRRHIQYPLSEHFLSLFQPDVIKL